MATLTLVPRDLTLTPGDLTLAPLAYETFTLDPHNLTLFPYPALALGPALQLIVTAAIKPKVTVDLKFKLSDSALLTGTALRLGFSLHSSLELSPPNHDPASTAGLELLLLPAVAVDHSTPIISGGLPLLPKYVGTYPSDMPLIVGPNDIHVIPDPNPIWNPATDGWFYPPPDSGVGDARWVVDDLPDPSGFSGQFYWLGDPSPLDGTSGIAAACRQWNANGGTPGQPAWRSVYPYKPSVREHVNYGPGGNILTKTKGVRFNLQFIEHMWMDWGTPKDSPFSWVMVGIIMDYPSAGYVHTLMDVGGNPQSYGAGVLNENQLAPDRPLSDLTLDTPNRVYMDSRIQEDHMLGALSGANDIVSPFNYATRPKMWFGVWNGADSLGGSYSTAGQYLINGTMPSTAQRHVIIGRRGGILSRNAASHLVLFEMRFWNSALVEEQLLDQYHQLSATWDFSQYS